MVFIQTGPSKKNIAPAAGQTATSEIYQRELVLYFKHNIKYSIQK